MTRRTLLGILTMLTVCAGVCSCAEEKPDAAFMESFKAILDLEMGTPLEEFLKARPEAKIDTDFFRKVDPLDPAVKHKVFTEMTDVTSIPGLKRFWGIYEFQDGRLAGMLLSWFGGPEGHTARAAAMARVCQERFGEGFERAIGTSSPTGERSILSPMLVWTREQDVMFLRFDIWNDEAEQESITIFDLCSKDDDGLHYMGIVEKDPETKARVYREMGLGDLLRPEDLTENSTDK